MDNKGSNVILLIPESVRKGYLDYDDHIQILKPKKPLIQNAVPILELRRWNLALVYL